MFQVGDMVKYRSDILEGPEWIGIVVKIGHNGFNEWLSVMFFNDIASDHPRRIAAASKFAKVS